LQTKTGSKECPFSEPALNDIRMTERAIKRMGGVFESSVLGSRGMPVRNNREGPLGVASGQAVEKYQLRHCEERFLQACPSMIKAGVAFYNSLFI
jgi:hypothetical protein